MFRATVLAMVASTALTVGLYFMKRAAERLPSLGGGWRPSAWWAFVRDGWWMLGLVLQLGGYGLYLAVIRHAPLSIVHTALNGGIAFFVVLAMIGLGERVRRWEWIGIGAVVTGLIALGLSFSNEDAAGGMAHGTVEFSAAIVSGAVLALLADRQPGRAIGLSVASGLLLGLASVYAKSLASLDSLAAALTSRDLALTLGANIVGFALMQAAMQVGRGVVVVPIFSMLSNIVPIVGGILVFGETLPRAGPAAVLRPLAFVLAIGGGCLLATLGEATRDLG
jgi:drug/metabolite transporter (DMT)-like permease